MKNCYSSALVLFGMMSASGVAAVDAPSTEPSMKDELHAELMQDAARRPANPPLPSTKSNVPAAIAANPTLPPSTAKKAMAPSPTPKPGVTTPTASAAASSNVKGDAPTMMPQVEVRKNRITELDRQVHAKDLEIEKETEKTHATETDKALNDSKTSGFLSFLGGRSAAVGEDLAKQRVMLLEVERDLVSEIALAKTKEEKADLQKQLNEIKAMRRDLEKPR